MSAAAGSRLSATARSPGSYFLSVQDSTVDNDPEPRPAGAGFGALAQMEIPFSPLEMFQRVSRSLSPIRHYLNGSESEGDDSEGDVDFWGTDGRFLSGEEESDDEEEDEESSDEDDDEEEEDESDGEAREGGEERARRELDDLDELIGHR